ncbi:hypothetical protein C8Q80DRAFT_815112 [Daedaleopsis nitida]|nr:hypothetical protein C8Q80DRAFT_815112 [Daedaleopsis nitida]
MGRYMKALSSTQPPPSLPHTSSFNDQRGDIPQYTQDKDVTLPYTSQTYPMSPRDNAAGRKPFNPDRRCHWFDSNGRPYHRLDGGLGCPRQRNCYFAHPTDLEVWRKARVSGEPPLQYLTDDEYRLIVGRHRSPGARPVGHPPRYRSPSGDRDRRRRERSPAKRSRSREREPTLASRLRSRRSMSRERGGPAEGRPYGQRSSRSRSPFRGRLQAQRTTPPLQYGAPPPRDALPYGSIPEGPRNGGTSGTPRNSAVFPKMEAMDVSMREVMAPTQGMARESSIASTHVPSHRLSPARIPAAPNSIGMSTAAEPSTSVTITSTQDTIKSMLESSALQWQQISTAVAAAKSAVPKPGAQNVAGDLTADEKHKIWTSRIELLAAATRLHNDTRSMENDIKDYKQLVESFSYQALPADDRSVIEGHLHTLQGQMAQKLEELKKILTQLTNAKFWPTHTHRQAPALDQYNGNPEVASQIQTVKESVLQLHSMFQAVGTRWEQISTQLQSNGSSSQANTFLAEAIVPAELEKIRDTLSSIENRLGTLESEIARPKEVILEQVDAIVAENVQAVVLASTGNVQAQPPAPRAALTDEQLRTLQVLQQNAAATGQQVARLSQEITQLAARNDQLQTENMQLQAENAQLRQQLEELQAAPSSSGDSQKIDRMQAEIRALNAAVMAYISHSPNIPPANANPVPNVDAIVQQITPQIVKSIPEMIGPELQTMRNQLQDSLRTQQSESAKELSLKMSLTLQAVEAIRGLVGGKNPSVLSPRPGNAAVAVNGNSQANGN